MATIKDLLAPDATPKPYGVFYPMQRQRLFTFFMLMPTFVHPAQYIDYPMPNCRAIYIDVDGDKKIVSKRMKKILSKCDSIDFDILSEKKYLSRYDTLCECTQIVLFSTVAGVDIKDIKQYEKPNRQRGTARVP